MRTIEPPAPPPPGASLPPPKPLLFAAAAPLASTVPPPLMVSATRNTRPPPLPPIVPAPLFASRAHARPDKTCLSPAIFGSFVSGRPPKPPRSRRLLPPHLALPGAVVV